MRHGVLALTLVLLLPAVLLAAQVVTLGDGEPVDVRVLETRDAGVVLEFEVSSFVKTPVEIDGRTFYSLALGEEGITLDAGYPELPSVARSIVIPDDAAMTYRVVDSHFVEYDGVRVVPSKGNLSRKIDPASVPYEFGSVYDENAWYPSEVVTARDPYIMRDVRGQTIVVSPFQVNPVTGGLRVYDRIVVEAVPAGPAKVNALTSRPAKLDPEFAEIYADHFLNYGAVSDRYPDVADVGNMLVICYDSFMTAMEPFVEWKNQMGVPCEMVSVADAGGTASGIDTYVQNYYDTNGLTYLLLVGDAAQCPSPTVSNLSDPTYSLTAGTDNYGDLFVGRFSAETVAQVETQVLRSVEYEKRPLAGAAWYHKGTGVASNQGTGDDDEYDDEHQDNIRDLLMAFTYTEVDQIYDPSGTAAMVSTALNDGRSTVNYTGHGSTTSWGSTGFDNADVNALVNDNMLPFMTSVACLNGSYGSTTCFAEAWLRATNGTEPTGAIGMYASTISQSWSPPMEGQDEVIDLLVGEAKRSFGALCFQGSSSMIDVYGTDGEDEFLHWTIFGDPAIKVRTDTPTDITVNHLDVMFPSMTTFDVEVVGVEGALCSIYGNGVNYGTATTDATGNATINLTAAPPVGETLTLTVTGFNLMTYTADMQVIVPVSYTIDPSSVPINTSTDVTVTVLDSLSNPVSDVYVEIDGWGVTPISGTTGPSGDVVLTVNAPYGEDLTIYGQESGESYHAFDDVIPVTGGTAFGSADVDASVPSIGLTGMLAPYYEGTITGTSSETGFDLYASGCGVDASTSSGGSTTVDLLVTPTSTGTVQTALAKSGFDIYLEDVTVQVVYGQLSGTVSGAVRDPIAGAAIKGYAAGADTATSEPVFETVSAGDGTYTVEGDLEVDYYDVYVSKFGYLTLQEEVFVQYGANVVDFTLDSAPSGIVSGTVTQLGTGDPLEATIKVYRADTGELYTQVTSDTLAGGAYSVELPYFNYSMFVRSYHHIPETRGITVDSATETEDFVLEETLANILVIDDLAAKNAEQVKVDKTGAVLATAEPSKDKSSTEFETDLVALGYDVTVETAAATDSATWLNYDFIVWASGDNTSPVAVTSYQTDLENYVAAGGKLLIEGGELAYDAASYPGYPTFAQNVLHANDWEHDSSGSVTVEDATHPVATVPNALGTIDVTYSNYGDADSYIPESDAHIVCDWSSYGGLASVLVYDDTPDPTSGQIVFYSFDYASAGTGRIDLLENSVTYLLAQESEPTGSISGTVMLVGETDWSGVTVTAYPGGETATTTMSGQYTLSSLYAGTYTVEATKDQWSTAEVTGVSVSEETLTPGIDMMLVPLASSEQCDSPALAIPDNVPSGVTTTLEFTDDMLIDDLEVYVDITHTFIGDLIVEVTSPRGTTVRLHNEGGGSADNLVGWYESELASYETLDACDGEPATGTWTLFVSDNAGYDTGTVNSWCVKVTEEQGATGVDDGVLDAPSRHVLRGASPNPFNPVTEIAYGLPSESEVSIKVYDVTGRLVRVLRDGVEPAGYHSVTWDGRDDRGASVASGVYFCRMQSEEFTGSSKLVLLK